MAARSNFHVVVRLRPPLQRELQEEEESDASGSTSFQSVVHVDEEANSVSISESFSSNNDSGCSVNEQFRSRSLHRGDGDECDYTDDDDDDEDDDDDGDRDRNQNYQRRSRGFVSSPSSPNSHRGVGSNGMLTVHRFTFDRVFGEDSTQEEVYSDSVRQAVASTLQGYNATVLAYGQTGTGKTYTMEGFAAHEKHRGMVPRAVDDIFHFITTQANSNTRFLVRASYLQIYNEAISDLLSGGDVPRLEESSGSGAPSLLSASSGSSSSSTSYPRGTSLAVREDKRRGVYVEGLSEWVVRSPREVFELMRRGSASRATAATHMNDVSSRSHSIFILIVEQHLTVQEGDSAGTNDGFASKSNRESRNNPFSNKQRASKQVRQVFKYAKLNFVDLAGSERVSVSGATGQRLSESKKINQSLSALGNVIAALTQRDLKISSTTSSTSTSSTSSTSAQHIPYRDSKLTRILEDSLGGNCKTTMLAMISPSHGCFLESLSTLKFANRAKNIRNTAWVNEDLDAQTLLQKYESELLRLRQELSERTRNVVDKRKLIDAEEQRRKAEKDKMDAITTMERLSIDLMREKEEKRRLEVRIHEMSSQLLTGGGEGGDPSLITSTLLMHGYPSLEAFIQETPAFKQALQQEQQRFQQVYEARMNEIEMERQRERQSVQSNNGGNESNTFKELLLKQREIMIQLMNRLSEREKSILVLTEQLEKSQKQKSVIEDQLDSKTASLIQMQQQQLQFQQQQKQQQQQQQQQQQLVQLQSSSPLSLSVAIESTSGASAQENNKESAARVWSPPSPSHSSLSSSTSSSSLTDSMPTPLPTPPSTFKMPFAATSQHQIHSSHNQPVRVFAVKSNRGSSLSPANVLELPNSPVHHLHHSIDTVPSSSSSLPIKTSGTASPSSMQHVGELLHTIEQQNTAQRTLMTQLAALREENESLKQRANGSHTPINLPHMSASPTSQGSDHELFHRYTKLEQRYQTQLKERLALKTILETKLKALVDRIASSVAVVDSSPMDSQSWSSPSSLSLKQPHQQRSPPEKEKEKERLTQTKKEIEVLQKLVDASVLALRNSMVDDVIDSPPNVVARATYASAPSTPLASAQLSFPFHQPQSSSPSRPSQQHQPQHQPQHSVPHHPRRHHSHAYNRFVSQDQSMSLSLVPTFISDTV